MVSVADVPTMVASSPRHCGVPALDIDGSITPAKPTTITVELTNTHARRIKASPRRA
jgi:hypothetical protein